MLAIASVPAAIAGQASPPSGAPANSDELYQLGQQLFDQLAPAEVKAQYEFPTRERWDDFARRLEGALTGDSLAELAAFTGEARGALLALRMLPEYQDLADWLEQRIDEIDGAKELTDSATLPAPKGPAPKPPPPPLLPHYDVWLRRVHQRARPPRADLLMPKLRAAFAAEGVPPELAWLAEAESSLNPEARSPVGAKGLFQFMPDTAKAMGLRTFLPDDRTDPDKSARAAARYLRMLYGKFRNWALVLAAYNAGEGRVARALAARRASTFSAIADTLPAETRMYVPKVCALVATRTGVTPDKLPAPRP
jgi:membrane-bound lytic murein transglycosylase D